MARVIGVVVSAAVFAASGSCILVWYYNRNRGAYLLSGEHCQGSRLTKSWMLSLKSSLYSEVISVCMILNGGE
ncbi:MAG: hypothetical protein IPH59_01370 [bacterium]|nr:hypothetical protein [bacterium]